MSLQIGEILQKISEAPSKEQKIEVMRKYDETYFLNFCATFYNPAFVPEYKSREDIPRDIKFDEPPVGHAETTIIRELSRLHIWSAGYVRDRRKLDELTLATLQGMELYEASVWQSYITGSRIPANGFCEDLVREAYPGLLKHDVGTLDRGESEPEKKVTFPSPEEVEVSDPTFLYTIEPTDKNFSLIQAETEKEAVAQAIEQGVGSFVIYHDAEEIGTHEDYTQTGRLSKKAKERRGL